jgi:hypothetical protein
MPIIREELSPKGNIIRKLGYFAVGLAVGFTLLGVFQRARQQEIAKRRAAAEAEARQPFVPALPIPGQAAGAEAAAPQAPAPAQAEPVAPPASKPAS